MSVYKIIILHVCYACFDRTHLKEAINEDNNHGPVGTIGGQQCPQHAKEIGTPVASHHRHWHISNVVGRQLQNGTRH